MAAPKKEGIPYFPYDVDIDQDDKLAMIIGEFGIKGETIYVKLLAWIYKHHGYYMPWDEVTQLKFAARVTYILGGSQANVIQEVVKRCVKWGIFDKAVFDSFQILTSKRIQATWLDATRKRKDRQIRSDIWIKRVNDGIEAEETQKTAEETPQSKVKERKVKQSNASNISGNPMVYETIARQLMQFRAELSIEQAIEEAKKMLQKDPRPGTNYIKAWAENIRIKQRVVIMRSPFGGEAQWTEEQYERQKNSTDFKFLRYDEI